MNSDSFVGGWVCLLLAFLVGWALSSSSLFLLFSLLVEEGSATSCFDLLTLTSSASTPLLSWLLTLARSWPCLLLLLRWLLLAEGSKLVLAVVWLLLLVFASCCWLACGCSGGKSWRWLAALVLAAAVIIAGGEEPPASQSSLLLLSCLATGSQHRAGASGSSSRSQRQQEQSALLTALDGAGCCCCCSCWLLLLLTCCCCCCCSPSSCASSRWHFWLAGCSAWPARRAKEEPACCVGCCLAQATPSLQLLGQHLKQNIFSVASIWLHNL